MAKRKSRKSGKTKQLKARKSSRREAYVEEDEAPSRKSSRRSKSSRGSKRTTKKSASRGKAPKGGAEVMCRNCKESFTMNVQLAREQEVMTCPVCEHRSQAPNDDILHQIDLYKGMESKSSALAIIFVVIGVASMAFWSVYASIHGDATDSAMFFGPIGLSVVSLMISLVFATKYERGRWATFF